MKFFPLHIPACQEAGDRVQGQLWYKAPGAERVKNLAQGPDSSSLLELEPIITISRPQLLRYLHTEVKKGILIITWSNGLFNDSSSRFKMCINVTYGFANTLIPILPSLLQSGVHNIYLTSSLLSLIKVINILSQTLRILHHISSS